MLKGCCPRAAGARGGGALRACVPGLPAVALEAPAHQQRAGARQQGNQAPLARGAGFPSEGSLLRLVGAVMCDQAETWSGSRYFSERKMAEMHDAALRKGASGRHDWAELEKTAGKMVESSLELADRVESA